MSQMTGKYLLKDIIRSIILPLDGGGLRWAGMLTIVVCFVLFFQLEANSEGDLIQLKAAIHMSSTISGSKCTLEEITETAKDNR